MTSKWFASSLAALAFTAATLMSAAPAPADDQGPPDAGPADQQGAPQGNGPNVARVSVVQGKVVVQRGDSNTQVAASVNAPLLPGDYITTGSTARSEVQFDGFTMLRLGGGVQARITANDSNARTVQLADGTIEVSILRDDGPIDVETPSVTVRAQNQGAYRITIGSDGSTWVTARRGTVTVITPQHTYDLQTGKTLVARGSASSPSVAYTTEVGYDSFDEFNSNRDRIQVAALTDDQNLNPDIAGYDNLNSYGQWQDVSGYGNVWVPNEPSGWSPYSDGSWAWEGGYGWTWVGSEPWGWVPYHYGRWFYSAPYGWCWYPPPVATYPVWSPALVGFFGFGGGGWGFGFGFGFGSIGWVPLAPYEPFYSWYPGWSWYGGGWGWNRGWGGWGSHVTNINITNVTNVYRNFYHGGAHGTLTNNFHNGNFSHIAVVDPHTVSHIGTLHGAVPVTPSAGNLRFTNHDVHAPVNISKAFSDPRFSSGATRVAHTPFTEQQHTVAQGLHGNLSTHEAGTATGHVNEPVTTGHDNAPAAGHANAPVTGHENAPVNTGRESAPATHAYAPSDPWQRFNDSRGGSSVGRVNATPERNASPERAAPQSGGQFSRSMNSNAGARPPQNAGSWGRFSQQRGDVRAPESSGARGGYSPYERGGAYSRGSYPQSYSRGSYPQSYSRGSYPQSYSRGSYPQSYSRGSYPQSYSRGSYPSYSAPRSYSGGGSGGYSHSGGGGGGGGGGHAGGGRPPH